MNPQDINAPIRTDGKAPNQPIAVCIELPGGLSDKEARTIINAMMTLAETKFQTDIRQMWVHRWDPSCGSSPVFYCP